MAPLYVDTIEKKKKRFGIRTTVKYKGATQKKVSTIPSPVMAWAEDRKLYPDTDPLPDYFLRMHTLQFPVHLEGSSSKTVSQYTLT